MQVNETVWGPAREWPTAFSAALPASEPRRTESVVRRAPAFGDRQGDSGSVLGTPVSDQLLCEGLHAQRLVGADGLGLPPAGTTWSSSRAMRAILAHLRSSRRMARSARTVLRARPATSWKSEHLQAFTCLPGLSGSDDCQRHRGRRTAAVLSGVLADARRPSATPTCAASSRIAVEWFLVGRRTARATDQRRRSATDERRLRALLGLTAVFCAHRRFICGLIHPRSSAAYPPSLTGPMSAAARSGARRKTPPSSRST